MFNRQLFRAKVIAVGLTLERVAIEIGINPATLNRKMSGESDFTRCEMQNIRRILMLDISEFEAIFFAPELTETQYQEKGMVNHGTNENGSGGA